MGSWIADKIISGVIGWFDKVVLSALSQLWGLLSATVLQSPDVTSLPQVRSVASTSLVVVNAVYVLAFLYAAILVMGRGTIQSRYGPGELIPRLVLGQILANFALPLCSAVIGVANAVTQAITADPITSKGSLAYLQATTSGAINSATIGNSPKAFLLSLLGLIIAVLVGGLLIQWIIRLGLLIVVAGIAPIALSLHGTPQTEGAAKLWWRTFTGTIATVAVQAVFLHTALKVFLTPGDNLRVLGLPGVFGSEEPGALMNLLIVICLLLGVLKIPALMGRYVTQNRPGGAARVLRLVVVQQLTRGLSHAKTPPRAPSIETRGWPTR